jgi:hypothetical protein
MPPGGQKASLRSSSPRHALVEHDLDRHHLMWAVGESCRNVLRRAPFFTLCGSQSATASLQPDDLAGLGKADGDRIRRPAGGQSSWVREAARPALGPTGQARDVLDAHCTLACRCWYDATQDDRAPGCLHRWYEGPISGLSGCREAIIIFPLAPHRVSSHCTFVTTKLLAVS